MDLTARVKLREGLSSRIGYDVFWPTQDWRGPHSGPATFAYAELTGEF